MGRVYRSWHAGFRLKVCGFGTHVGPVGMLTVLCKDAWGYTRVIWRNVKGHAGIAIGVCCGLLDSGLRVSSFRSSSKESWPCA